MRKSIIFIFISFSFIRSDAASIIYEPNWTSLDRRPTPQWFLDAKFGIFIHWGIYSVPGWGVRGEYAEWYWNRINDRKPDNPWWQYHKKVWGEGFEYPQFAELFKAQHFNPDEWAEMFLRSGAKYVVLTSKHHDGFCLWPSEHATKTWQRPWNAVDTGPRRDLLGELAVAVRKKGLKFGFYYSLYEWYNPLWLKDRSQYVEYHMIPQFKDVVTRYQPSIIFGDGEWDMNSSDWQSPYLLAWLYNEALCKEEVIVNDRWGKETRHKHGGYFTTEYGAGLPDASHPWEENRGMGHSYGWNRAETIDDYKTAKELIWMLCDIVSRGGNLLLNIGPTDDGRIPVIMQDRLIEIGRWLKINGEAIYGTRFAGRSCQWTEGKIPEQKFGQFMVKYDILQLAGQDPIKGQAVKQIFFTRKDSTLFAITAGWPGKKLLIKSIQVPQTSKIFLLGHDKPIQWKQIGNDIELDLSDINPDKLPSAYSYSFKLPHAHLIN